MTCFGRETVLSLLWFMDSGYCDRKHFHYYRSLFTGTRCLLLAPLSAAAPGATTTKIQLRPSCHQLTSDPAAITTRAGFCWRRDSS